MAFFFGLFLFSIAPAVLAADGDAIELVDWMPSGSPFVKSQSLNNLAITSSADLTGTGQTGARANVTWSCDRDGTSLEVGITNGDLDYSAKSNSFPFKTKIDGGAVTTVSVTPETARRFVVERHLDPRALFAGDIMNIYKMTYLYIGFPVNGEDIVLRINFHEGNVSRFLAGCLTALETHGHAPQDADAAPAVPAAPVASAAPAKQEVKQEAKQEVRVPVKTEAAEAKPKAKPAVTETAAAKPEPKPQPPAQSPAPAATQVAAAQMPPAPDSIQVIAAQPPESLAPPVETQQLAPVAPVVLSGNGQTQDQAQVQHPQPLEPVPEARTLYYDSQPDLAEVPPADDTSAATDASYDPHSGIKRKSPQWKQLARYNLRGGEEMELRKEYTPGSAHIRIGPMYKVIPQTEADRARYKIGEVSMGGNDKMAADSTLTIVDVHRDREGLDDWYFVKINCANCTYDTIASPATGGWIAAGDLTAWRDDPLCIKGSRGCN